MDALRLPDRLVSRLPGKLGERGDKPVVSLVRLHGVITSVAGPLPRSVINAAAVEKTLERAFAPEGLAAVALLVNSPGGSPTPTSPARTSGSATSTTGCARRSVTTSAWSSTPTSARA